MTAHILSYRCIHRYLVCRLKRLEARDFSHVRFTKRTRKVFYWEHLGMLDDAEYAEKAIKRVQSMEASGILSGKNLLITAETKQNPISIKSVNILIQEYLI